MNNLLEIFKYSKNDIIVVLSRKKPWFNAVQMCKIIDYSDPKSAIRTLVDDEYVSYLKDLLDDITIYPNAQPNALFINEYGLYTLLIRSKKS